MSNMGKYHRYTADRLVLMGECNERMNKYDKALKYYLDALEIFSVKLGDDNPKAIDLRIRIGSIQFKRQRFEDALEAYSHALYMNIEILGENHPVVAEIHERISVVHCEKQQPNEAVKDMKRALRVYREEYGDNNLTVVRTVESIGTIYLILGNFEKAAVIFAEAVKLKMATLGKTHPDVATSLVKWGSTHEKLGDNRKAMKIMKKAYSILSPDDAYVATVLDHIGTLYLKNDRVEKAMKTHLRSLKLKKEAHRHDNDHPDLARTLVNIGLVLLAKNRTDKASRCMNEALGIYRKRHGDDHVTVADTLGHIGKIYHATGNAERAIKAHGRVLFMRRSVLGDRHPEVARIMCDLASVHRDGGNAIAALNLYARALGILGKSEGRETMVYAEGLMGAAGCMEGMGDWGSAREALMEVRRIYEVCGVGEEEACVALVRNRLKRCTGHGGATSGGGGSNGAGLYKGMTAVNGGLMQPAYMNAIAKIQPCIKEC